MAANSSFLKAIPSVNDLVTLFNSCDYLWRFSAVQPKIRQQAQIYFNMSEQYFHWAQYFYLTTVRANRESIKNEFFSELERCMID